MPRGMPISLSTPTAPSWYSDMSTRIIFFSSPNRNSRHRLRQLGLADAGRAEEQQHAVGPIEAVLQRALVQHQPARDGVDRLPLADDARRRGAPRCRWKRSRDLAEHHVFRNLRDLRDHLDDVARR